MGTRQFSIAVFTLLAAGCQNWSMPSLPVIGAYRIDIQQGNVVTQDMVSKLQPGMTRGQVRFVLGTPLVTDIFHPDRWDYIYRYEKAGKLTENRRIFVVFKDDKLVRIEGDVVPAAGKSAATPAPSATPATGAASSAPSAASGSTSGASPAGATSSASAGTPVATPAPGTSVPNATAIPEGRSAAAATGEAAAAPEKK